MAGGGRRGVVLIMPFGWAGRRQGVRNGQYKEQRHIQDAITSQVPGPKVLTNAWWMNIDVPEDGTRTMSCFWGYVRGTCWIHAMVVSDG